MDLLCVCHDPKLPLESSHVVLDPSSPVVHGVGWNAFGTAGELILPRNDQWSLD